MHPDNLTNFAKATRNIAEELIAAGAEPSVVIEHMANALGSVMVAHSPAEEAAALLRIEAGKIEATIPQPADRTADQRELIELARHAHTHLNTLQVAGIGEGTAVTAFVNASIERVARARGAIGAAHWLRGLAALVEKRGGDIEQSANFH